jgi:phage baseplate assembly protein W
MSRARWFGINAPFLGGAQNILSRQVDERLIKNDLTQLLLTAPGERVMRPTFGTRIREFLFENVITQDLEDLRQNITNQIESFEKRVTVTDVFVESDPDNNLLTIKVFGYLNVDRFQQLVGPQPADLLVELELPTAKVNSG